MVEKLSLNPDLFWKLIAPIDECLCCTMPAMELLQDMAIFYRLTRQRAPSNLSRSHRDPLLGRLDLGRLAEAEFFDQNFFHPELLYLPGHRHGEVVGDLQVTRNLEIGDLPFAEASEVL